MSQPSASDMELARKIRRNLQQNQTYVSSTPYAENIGIFCLPSISQASWRINQQYCPKGFGKCPELIPNASQAPVVNSLAAADATPEASAESST